MTAHDTETDVALILEGTYPFVRGGVSSWVHEIITGLPELTFSLVYLGAEEGGDEQPRYELPPNVRHLHRRYLVDTAMSAATAKPRPGDHGYFSESARLHDWFKHPDSALDDGVFDSAILRKGRCDAACTADFFHSEAAWSQIVDNYSRFCPGLPFLSYFWAVRNTHAPLMKLLSIARTLPPSRIFHAVSTGYAGLLGAMLQRLSNRPLILTEHGIYTKERRIELQSMFLRDCQGRFGPLLESGMDHHDELWIRMFEGMGRITYAAADPIISLYEQNRQRQIADGAPAARTRIVPNGVDVERFAPLRLQRPAEIPHVLGLIGRIVPIKDIKTFIRMIAALVGMMPDAQGWIIGPQEEDPAYFQECKELVTTLHLDAHIQFLGFQRVEAVLPRLGLMVLTSISEAFPLVIGESFASGLPVLTTDVGACRELVEGRQAADRALGCGGCVLPIFDPDGMAGAAYALLSDPARWRAAQQAGIDRVERYYRQSSVIDSYREIYNDARGR